MKKLAYFGFLVAFSCHSFAAETYSCKGMDSTGTSINSVLTLVPTTDKNTYTATWTYANGSSNTIDQGTVLVTAKNIMTENYKSNDGVNVGQSTLYQISDKEILVSFSDMNTKTNQKTMGLGSCLMD